MPGKNGLPLALAFVVVSMVVVTAASATTRIGHRGGAAVRSIA